MEKCNRKEVPDLSSFFLIEFSDDSEARLDLKPAVGSVEVDNDDAQSSCDGLCGWVSDPDQEVQLRHDKYGFQDFCSVERPWEDDAEEEEGEVNMLAKRRQSNSKTCIEGGGRYHQPENEIERNKLFWETCLASGF